MRTRLAATLLSALGLSAWADGTVPCSLHCTSLRFSAATTTAEGQVHRLELTRRAADPPNGELRYLGEATAYTHGGYFRYVPPGSTTPQYLPCQLNLPDWLDANTNNIHDFLEVGQEVPASAATGSYEDPQRGPSEVKVTWRRVAGSAHGTCSLVWTARQLAFEHTFELIQYAGRLRYTRSDTNLTGVVDLLSSGNPDHTLAGPIRLGRLDVDHLELRSGLWTNHLGQTLAYAPLESLERSGANYVAFFTFADGDLSTPWADYDLWLMLLTDAADSNGNGIPDLTDPAPGATPPRLRLELAEDSLALTLEGDAGRSYEIEASTGLVPGLWQRQTILSLTNRLQTFPWPKPADRTRFWRARLR